MGKLFLVNFLAFITLLYFIGSKSNEFDRECTIYLERICESELHNKEDLEKALGYLEKNNLTKGYTSVLFYSTDNDIEHFYRNLKDLHKELTKPLGQYETRISHDKIKQMITGEIAYRDADVKLPNLISLYPYQKYWMFGLCLTIAIFIILWICVSDEE